MMADLEYEQHVRATLEAFVDGLGTKSSREVCSSLAGLMGGCLVAIHDNDGPEAAQLVIARLETWVGDARAKP